MCIGVINIKMLVPLLEVEFFLFFEGRVRSIWSDFSYGVLNHKPH